MGYSFGGKVSCPAECPHIVSPSQAKIPQLRAGELANEDHDTRSIQQDLGHKNITHTVRYTQLSPERFKNFWKD